jgi:hypothetical protein
MIRYIIRVPNQASMIDINMRQLLENTVGRRYQFLDSRLEK